MSGPTVMRPWSTVLDVSGPPIEAEASTFFDLADFFTTLKEDTQLVADAFTGIVNDANADFQGESAEAFATMVGDLGSTLALVPTTAEEASGFLRSHGTELEALRTEANAALGRANTRYGEVQQAKDNLELAQAGRNRLQNQVDNFDATVCGDESHRVQSQLDLDTASTGVRNAEGNLSEAEGALARSKTEYDGLVEDYRVLDNRTCTDLDNIALGDLSDPSWLEQAWNGISGFVVDVLSDIAFGFWDICQGIATQDWDRMLWGLSDLLGGFLTVLTILALFTPIGPGLILAFAATKLVVDAVLLHKGTTNARTGEQMTLTSLAFTALTVAASGAGYVQAGRASTSAATAGANSTNATARGQGALSDLVRSGRGAPIGTGQVSTVSQGFRTGATTASTQFVTAPSAATAYSQTAATALRTTVNVAPDAVQIVSTAQTSVSAVTTTMDHAAAAAPLFDETATVSTATVAPPIAGQITDLDDAGAVQSQAPAGYGVVVLVPAGEES